MPVTPQPRQDGPGGAACWSMGWCAWIRHSPHDMRGHQSVTARGITTRRENLLARNRPPGRLSLNFALGSSPDCRSRHCVLTSRLTGTRRRWLGTEAYRPVRSGMSGICSGNTEGGSASSMHGCACDPGPPAAHTGSRDPARWAPGEDENPEVPSRRPHPRRRASDADDGTPNRLRVRGSADDSGGRDDAGRAACPGRRRTRKDH